MPNTREVIAVAGVGDLGKYICEELAASDEFDVIVLSRGSKHQWCEDRQIPIYATDYTTASVLAILDTTQATTIISFINLANTLYIEIHASLLNACKRSLTCKRLIPSEWIGNSELFPLKPDFYATSREPFRQILRQQNEVEWTLFNPGWLADYFLPRKSTYISPIPDKFPVDPNGWRACIRGTGDEMQSWTCGREIGRAVVQFCKAEKWVSENLMSRLSRLPIEVHLDIIDQETVTYVAGEWDTFNAAIKIMESHYGRLLPTTHKSVEEIQHSLASHRNDQDDDFEALELAQVEEMMVMSHLACPKEKTMKHRHEYFAGMQFSGLEELLKHADNVDFV